MAQVDALHRAIDDDIYTVTSHPAPVDKDTYCRQSSYINPQTNGEAALPRCLNSGMDTSFTVENNSKAKLRWGTMALAVEMVFTLHGTTTAACPTVGAAVTAAAADTVYNRPVPLLSRKNVTGRKNTINGSVAFCRSFLHEKRV